MKEEPARSGKALLSKVCNIINHPKPEVVLEAGTALLHELKEKQVILGTRPGHAQ
jgi:hypothetical protein